MPGNKKQADEPYEIRFRARLRDGREVPYIIRHTVHRGLAVELCDNITSHFNAKTIPTMFRYNLMETPNDLVAITEPPIITNDDYLG